MPLDFPHRFRNKFFFSYSGFWEKIVVGGGGLLGHFNRRRDLTDVSSLQPLMYKPIAPGGGGNNIFSSWSSGPLGSS